jgi:hypothetical protein
MAESSGYKEPSLCSGGQEGPLESVLLLQKHKSEPKPQKETQ